MLYNWNMIVLDQLLARKNDKRKTQNPVVLSGIFVAWKWSKHNPGPESLLFHKKPTKTTLQNVTPKSNGVLCAINQCQLRKYHCFFFFFSFFYYFAMETFIFPCFSCLVLVKGMNVCFLIILSKTHTKKENKTEQ